MKRFLIFRNCNKLNFLRLMQIYMDQTNHCILKNLIKILFASLITWQQRNVYVNNNNSPVFYTANIRLFVVYVFHSFVETKCILNFKIWQAPIFTLSRISNHLKAYAASGCTLFCLRWRIRITCLTLKAHLSPQKPALFISHKKPSLTHTHTYASPVYR